MSLLNKKLTPRPYVVELTSPDGTTVEVKVEAYDAIEAIVAAPFAADKLYGKGVTRDISGIRPDVDQLRAAAMEERMVRRIVESALKGKPSKKKERKL